MEVNFNTLSVTNTHDHGGVCKGRVILPPNCLPPHKK